MYNLKNNFSLSGIMEMKCYRLMGLFISFKFLTYSSDGSAPQGKHS